MNRDRALKVVLVLVGLLFSAGIYPLVTSLWHPSPSDDQGDTMMLSLYVTLGILLLIAVRNPSEHRCCGSNYLCRREGSFRGKGLLLGGTTQRASTARREVLASPFVRASRSSIPSNSRRGLIFNRTASAAGVSFRGHYPISSGRGVIGRVPCPRILTLRFWTTRSSNPPHLPLRN
jgi:hypothetical protein